LALPPGPLHVSVNALETLSGPVDSLPLVVFVPLQPPDAVQLVAPVEFQVSVDDPPLAMLVGFAASVTVGVGATVTVASCPRVPPLPVHVSLNIVVAESAPVDWLPLSALAPLHPPDAVQPFACPDVHVSMDEPPDAIVRGLAVNVTVGMSRG
jgi:hypothetical protein